MQAFQRDLEKFKQLDTQVLGVSGDNLETHNKFAEKYKIAFPLIYDENMTIKDKYGRNRVTYLIDKKGIIRFIQQGVPENKDFLEQIRNLSKDEKI